LLTGIKPQPGVQEITLLDRFDDRRVGAFKFHGCNPFSLQTTEPSASGANIL
jgi:hypothetical protein